MFNFSKIFNKQKSIIFIEPEGIGDYYFIGPFFKYIKLSSKYKDYKVLFVAKTQHIDFVRANFGEYFDEIFDCNYDEYKNNKDYRRYLNNKINKYNIESVINLRTIIIDTVGDCKPRRKLVYNINAKYKYADYIKINDNKKFEKRFYKKYTNKYFAPHELVFEFERRRRFFETILEMDLKEVKMYNFQSDFIKKDESYIAISMESTTEKRMCSVDKWVEIINYLKSKGINKKLLFIGSPKIKERISQLVKKLNMDNYVDLTGKTSVSMLPFVLSKCSLLIAVETGTVHIAHSVGCKTICLSQGAFYNRYHPYNDDIVHYVYSKKFIDKYKQSDDQFKYEAWCGGQKWDLESVSIEDIISEIDKIVGGSNGR